MNLIIFWGILFLMIIVALKPGWIIYELFNPPTWCKKHECEKEEHGFNHYMRCPECYKEILKEI